MASQADEPRFIHHPFWTRPLVVVPVEPVVSDLVEQPDLNIGDAVIVEKIGTQDYVRAAIDRQMYWETTGEWPEA